MTDLASDMRGRIAAALPNVLAKALTDYEKFLDAKGESETSKTFKERHEACKAAVAHIAMIVKVAGEIGDEENPGGESQQKILETLLLDARKELENQGEDEV